jgi:hypothetical protein
MDEINTVANPTSEGEYSLAATIQNTNPKAAEDSEVIIRKNEFLYKGSLNS